jgi:hypothetical protein
MQDLPFIDQLQKLHTKQVGWMPTKQLTSQGKYEVGRLIESETALPSQKALPAAA